MATPILFPLLNPNEPEARLVATYVNEGQRVSMGDLLCTLETTKSTADLTAEQEGYIAGLHYRQGQSVRAGEVFCYLAETPDWVPATTVHEAQDTAETVSQPDLPSGLRITQPALALARAQHLDLATLPTGPLVTESLVQTLIEETIGPDISMPASSFDPMAIIIYGGGGHSKTMIDLLRGLGTYRIIGIVDDGLPAGETILGVPILGGKQVLSQLFAKGIRLAVNAVGGIGDISVRIRVFRLLAETGFVCPALVHPTAWVEPSSNLSPGVQVLSHAYIGSQARVGIGTLINTGAIISHDCQLGDYVNISPGAILAGEVKVGNGTLIGMGVTVNLGVKIGSRARLGNGATVKADVPENSVVRAGSIWPK